MRTQQHGKTSEEETGKIHAHAHIHTTNAAGKNTPGNNDIE